jgi:hypothetical protein
MLLILPVCYVSAACDCLAQRCALPQDVHQQAVVEAGQLPKLVAQQQRRRHYQHLLNAHLHTA